MMEDNTNKNRGSKRTPTRLKRAYDESTPTRIDPKLTKMQPPETNNIDNEAINVAVTTKNGADLTQAELETIRNKIEKMYMDCYSVETHDNYPKIIGRPIIDEGVLKLDCKNVFTQSWLQDKVSNMKINCAANKLPLKIVLQKDLPEKVKCELLLKNIKAQNNLQLMLHNMNPDIGVDKWTIYKVTNTDSGGLHIEVGIPRDILSRTLEKPLDLGFQTVEIHLVKDKEKERKVIAPISMIDLEEAGPSGSGRVGGGLENNGISEYEVSRRKQEDRDSSHQRPRSSILEPIIGKDESRQRQSAIDNSDSNALAAFLLFSRDHARFPDFVKRKCELAEKAIGTTVTEQHLVIAFLSNLPERRIARDLLNDRLPKNFKELRGRLDYYNYCEKCDKTGHLPDKCWSVKNK